MKHADEPLKSGSQRPHKVLIFHKWLRKRELYEFGKFLLDPVTPTLMHAGTPVPLTPKVLQTLLVLIEHPDRVVSKDEFHEAIWPGLFVEENALAQNVYLLRKALKERDPDEDYIENVPRVGYRFSGKIRITLKYRPRLPLVVAAAMFSILCAFLVAESRPSIGRGTRNQDAYDLYLMGRAIWAKRDDTRTPQALEYLREAIEKDPKFAQAWAALADLHAFERAPATEARKAAEWATVLNPKLAEPYATMGFIAMFHDWDWPAAERYFRQSLELNPDYLTGRQWFALYFTLSGRFAEAEAQLKEGLRREPLSLNLLHERCEMLYLSKNFAAAERECSKVLEIDPVFRFARQTLLQIHARLGNYRWIADRLGGDNASSDYRAPADSPARLALLREGPAAMWRTLAAETRARGGNLFGLAGYYMELGDAANAIETLTRAVEAHEFRLVYACVDPVFDPLRGDGRFKAALQRVCGSQTR